MKTKSRLNCLIASFLAIGMTFIVCGTTAGVASAQEPGDGEQATAGQSNQKHKSKKRGPGKEAAKGGEDIGKGAGKGAVSAGKGAGGAAADLATLHPVEAGGSLGKGAAGAGKDVGVGSAKGGVKIGKGVGHGIGKLGKKAVGKHHKKQDQK